MVKREISKGQKIYLKNIEPIKLNPNAKLKKVSSANRLKDRNLIFDSLWECLITQDIDSFKEILRSHIDAIGITELSKNSQTSKRTMYRTLSTEGNPTLKSISRILSALYGKSV